MRRLIIIIIRRLTATLKFIDYNVAMTFILIIIIIIMRAMSEYMTESEVRAVARWEVGSRLRIVRMTEQVGFEPVFEKGQK